MKILTFFVYAGYENEAVVSLSTDTHTHTCTNMAFSLRSLFMLNSLSRYSETRKLSQQHNKCGSDFRASFNWAIYKRKAPRFTRFYPSSFASFIMSLIYATSSFSPQQPLINALFPPCVRDAACSPRSRSNAWQKGYTSLDGCWSWTNRTIHANNNNNNNNNVQICMTAKRGGSSSFGLFKCL